MDSLRKLTAKFMRKLLRICSGFAPGLRAIFVGFVRKDDKKHA